VTRSAWLGLVLAIASCGGDPAAESAGSRPSAPVLTPVPFAESADTEIPRPVVEYPAFLDSVDARWTGDFSGMIERRVIRFLVVYGDMMYFLDGATARGITYETSQQFEEFVNSRVQTGRRRVHVMVIPVTRENLLPALEAGYGDIAAALLTATPGRRDEFDFGDPFISDVSEVVVAGPKSAPIASVGDLAGRTVTVRRSSSYFESLTRVSDSLQAAGLDGIELDEPPPYFEDEAILHSVGTGVFDLTVVDDYIADFWVQIHEDLQPHPGVVVNRGGEIAWAIRPDSPELMETINAFVPTHRRGTLMGNILFKRYLQNTDWKSRALAAPEIERFDDLLATFSRYGQQYDFDWLILAAQAYQESRLDQGKKSHRGAVGVMQLLPSTARAVGIDDISTVDGNVHAGAKYMRHIVDTYLPVDSLDVINLHLFALAAYNGGPTRFRRLRRRTAELNLDPNVWFGNVEIVAARDVGRENVQYVSNVYKYYVAYRMLADLRNEGLIRFEGD
jgi:membrane-bound lytic murein transglycosylase MltF